MNKLIGYAQLGNKMVNIYGDFFGDMTSENTKVVFQNGQTMDKRYFHNLKEFTTV